MSNQEAVATEPATEEPQVIEVATADSVDTDVEVTSPPPDESEEGVPAGEAVEDLAEDTSTPEVDSASEAVAIPESNPTAEEASEAAVIASEEPQVIEVATADSVDTDVEVTSPLPDESEEGVPAGEAVEDLAEDTSTPEVDSASEAVAIPESNPTAEEASEAAVIASEVDSVSEADITAENVSKPEADSVPEAAAKSKVIEGSTTDLSIHSLKRGHYLKGKVKNITDFGAFVDIGLPQDGLVHISELARKKVEKVADLVTVGDEVDVWIKRIDAKRGRISLTMVKPIALRLRDVADDAELEGTITRLESYGAFVDIGSERDGLVHISQITHDYIKHPSDTLSSGDTVQVKVLKVNRKKRQVDLSIKALLTPPEVAEPVPTKVRSDKKGVETPEAEDAAVPTAMALAYAAMQSKSDSTDSEEDLEVMAEISKRKQEMNDIVSRTLATSE